MKQKASWYFKRPQMLYNGVSYPTGIWPIDLSRKSIGWSLYDKGLHHENIKIISSSIIFIVVFQMFSNVYRLLRKLINFHNFQILRYILHLQVEPDHDLIHSSNLLKDVSFWSFQVGHSIFLVQCHETFASVLFSIAILN